MNDFALSSGLNVLLISGAGTLAILTLCLVGMILIRFAWDWSDDENCLKVYNRLGYVWFANLIAEALVLAVIVVQLQ